MEINIHDLHELALLVSVLDLEKLSSQTKIPLRYMRTDGLGDESRIDSKLARIVNLAKVGPEELIAQLKAYPTDDKPDAASSDWRGNTLRDAVGVVEQHRAGLISTKFANEQLAKLGHSPVGQLGSDPGAVGDALAHLGASSAHADSVSPDTPATDTPTAELDSPGLPHDTRIHSDPAKTNKDGTWRARRGVDEATVQAVTAELRAKQIDDAAGAAPNGDEPVATETHALPVTITGQTDVTTESSELVNTTPAAAPDLGALIEASQGTAGDSSDSLTELLAVSRDFISAHSTAAFNALKAAVAPLADGPEHNGAGGKAIQALTPGERRLLRACIANYALFA